MLCHSHFYTQKWSPCTISLGFEKAYCVTAENSVCGYIEYFKTWENYLDTKIVEYYENSSGNKIAIEKPKSMFATHRLYIPPEIWHNSPRLDTVKLVDSESFVKDEPKNFKIDNCRYIWNVFRDYPDELKACSINNAFIVNPSGAYLEDGKFFSTPGLPDELRKILRLRDESLANAENKLKQIKKHFKNQHKEFVFVGIHSRRKDHLVFQKETGQIQLKFSYYIGILSDIFTNIYQSLYSNFF